MDYKEEYYKLQKVNEILKKENEDYKKIIETFNLKGSNCSRNGNKYERLCYNIVKNTTINNKKFNNQSDDELGKSSKRPDLICTYNNIKIPIEIKKSKTPDWGQFTIKFNNNKWCSNSKLIDSILNKNKLFNFTEPCFLKKKLHMKNG